MTQRVASDRSAVEGFTLFVKRYRPMLESMPNASFEIRILPDQEFMEFGSDGLIFLFSANKGSEYGSLKKVASGGELSRIMLVIKSILAEFEQLPTLMFDEIDSGVSGKAGRDSFCRAWWITSQVMRK